jgi:iron uptake system component EfeO
MYCPGATTPRVPFTVTGTATSAPVTDTKALLDQGTVNYGTYVEAQIGFLVTNVQPLVAAIKSGDLAAAKVAYAKARPYYERIEPVAESFQDLEPRDRLPRRRRRRPDQAHRFPPDRIRAMERG